MFGFAQSNALQEEGSENNGLRDQRLAIEWTRDNIAHFGGDPSKISILGQSSGGELMNATQVCQIVDADKNRSRHWHANNGLWRH